MNFKYDPTINLGHIGSMLVFLVTATAGYYDLKSDVRVDKNTADLRQQKQDIVDANQDRRLDEVKLLIEKSVIELKSTIRDNAPRR